MTRPHYRAMFVSDVHLGTRACRADDFLEFLREHDAETIYLVGDIVDFWGLKRGGYWPQSHNDVVQKLLRKVRKGSRIVYVPGNHDEALRGYIGAHFGGIEVLNETIHETGDGRQILVIHGDSFDGAVKIGRWMGAIGDHSYDVAAAANTALNRVRRMAGLDYWSLSQHLKMQVKQAVKYIDRFEDVASAEAQRRGVDGIICGHIHHAANRRINGVSYYNCGDWVDTRSALVEDWDGTIRLMHWQAVKAAAQQTIGPREPVTVSA